MVLVVGLLGLQMEIGAPLMAGCHFLKLQSGFFLDIKNYCHVMGLYLSSVFIYCLLGWGGASHPSSLYTFIQQMSVRTPQRDVGVQSYVLLFLPKCQHPWRCTWISSLTLRIASRGDALTTLKLQVFFFFFCNLLGVKQLEEDPCLHQPRALH